MLVSHRRNLVIADSSTNEFFCPCMTRVALDSGYLQVLEARHAAQKDFSRQLEDLPSESFSDKEYGLHISIATQGFIKAEAFMSPVQ